MRRPRVLVDQSGYELANLGDLAMLQHAVRRLQRAAPGAEIRVLTTVPATLAALVPGAIPVAPWPLPPDGGDFRFPSRVRRVSGFAWKGSVHPALSRWPERALAAGVAHEVATADLVVAAGGGYLTDTFTMHARGVLGVLAAAQHRGIATGMLGQGIGPLARPGLRRYLGEVLPRLAVLGARDPKSAAAAQSLGVAADRVVMTGDDALPTACGEAYGTGAAAVTSPADRLGVNLRDARYAGPVGRYRPLLRDVLASFCVSRVDVLAALPVHVHGGADLASTASIIPDVPGARVELDPVASPQALATRCGSCRAVLTGSYHAAVFALAQGVPVVGMSASAYYDGKFDALAAQFPGAVRTVRVDRQGARGALLEALAMAWDLPGRTRAEAAAAARTYRDRADALVERLVAGALGQRVGQP